MITLLLIYEGFHIHMGQIHNGVAVLCKRHYIPPNRTLALFSATKTSTEADELRIQYIKQLIGPRKNLRKA